MNALSFSRTLLILLVLLAPFVPHATANQAPLDKKEIRLFDATRERPILLTMWYSKSSNPCEKTLCFSATQKMDKVFLLSHGSFGSARELNWLGFALASQGWIVAGISHFGESWAYGPETIDPSTVAKFWLRRDDIRFVLDSLPTFKNTNRHVNTSQVVMAGHSSGGFTAATLLGVTPNADRMNAYCGSESAAKDRGCSFKPRGNSSTLPAIQEITDNRIRAAILLDPAMGPSIAPEQLQNIQVPTLVLGASDNDYLPFSQHAKYFAQHMKNATLVEVNEGAGHFSFIDTCEHKHQSNGIAICNDRPGTQRTLLQKKIMLPAIFSFLTKLPG